MKSLPRISLAMAALLLLAACQDSTVVGPPDIETQASVTSSGHVGTPNLSLLNWNIYIGTNVDVVLTALTSPDPADDVPALLAAVETLIATDFPTRAEAIADRIAKTRPLVLGLQEVWDVDVDLSGLGVPVVIDQDFLEILQAALAVRGLTYDVAGIVTNTVAQPFPGISAIDHDVILTDRKRVTVISSLGQNFANNVGEVALGVSLVRGYVAVGALIRGTSYLFVNTHLEPNAPGFDFTLLRAAQATELVVVAGAAERVVLMGDLNDIAGSPMHHILTGAGFTDVWAALHPNDVGLTCCHASDLSNPVSTFTQRIDYIMTRGVGHPNPGVQGLIGRLGGLQGEKVPGPVFDIWPSDHAGLVARLFD